MTDKKIVVEKDTSVSDFMNTFTSKENEESDDEGIEVHLYTVMLVNNQVVSCIDSRPLTRIQSESPSGYLVFTGDPEVSLGQGFFPLDKIICAVENLTPDYIRGLQEDLDEEKEETEELPPQNPKRQGKKPGKWS